MGVRGQFDRGDGDGGNGLGMQALPHGDLRAVVPGPVRRGRQRLRLPVLPAASVLREEALRPAEDVL
jgi:hypothetical protein